MSTIKAWGGRRAQKLTRVTLDTKGRACVLALPGCTRVATTAHHVIPHSLRGPDTLDNLVPACLPCNQRQGARVNVDGRPPEASDPRDWFDPAIRKETTA